MITVLDTPNQPPERFASQGIAGPAVPPKTHSCSGTTGSCAMLARAGVSLAPGRTARREERGMAEQTWDIAIIGGGIVGLATALELLNRRSDLRLVILEKEGQIGQHQTGHNSGV